MVEFSKVSEGAHYFSGGGGPSFSREVPNRNHLTCGFPGGGGSGPPVPPSGSALEMGIFFLFFLKTKAH